MVARSRQGDESRSWVASLLRQWQLQRCGRSGDMQEIWRNRHVLQRARGIVAIGHSASLPTLALRRQGILSARVLHASIGLETVWESLSRKQRGRLGCLMNTADTTVVFSAPEKEFLVEEVGLEARRVCSVPYGFETVYHPEVQKRSGNFRWDIISVGADVSRDFTLLAEWAWNHPDCRVLLVVSGRWRHSLRSLPPNVEVRVDEPLEAVFRLMSYSAVSVIPLKGNRYTAGTTYLIHSLAMGLPTLVARTGPLTDLPQAPADPFLTYSPGDRQEFDRQVGQLLVLQPSERWERARACQKWARMHGDGRAWRQVVRDFLGEVLG